MNIFQSEMEPLPIGWEVSTVAEEGAVPAHVLLTHKLGLALPTEGGIGFLPVGQLLFRMAAEDAEKYGKEVVSKAEGLPRTAAILRASSMAEAERLAHQMRHLEEGKDGTTKS